MKRLSLIALILMSSHSFSAEVSKKLLPSEIRLAIELSNKYEVPFQTDGVCGKTEFEVVSRVKGFNPASWRLLTGGKSVKLSNLEIQKLIGLINRVRVPLREVDSITIETRAMITGESCGFNPNNWSISFDDLN